MRILHTADPHIGKATHGSVDPARGISTRLIDQEKTLDWIARTAEENSVDAITLSGDLTDAKILNGPALYVVMRWLEKLQMPLVAVAGNHDLEGHVGRMGTIAALDGLFSCFTTERPRAITVGAADFLCLPYPSRGQIIASGITFFDAAQYMGAILQKLLHESRMETKIVLGHMTVAGAKYNPQAQPNLMTGSDFVIDQYSILPANAELALMGHIHTRQDIGRIIYPGAPLAYDFGDGTEDKGVIVIDTEKGTTDFIRNPHNRRFVTLRDDDPRPLHTPVDDCFVRVVTTRKLSDKEKREFTDFIGDSQGATFCGFVDKSEREVRPEAKAVVEAESSEGAIEAFCKARGGEFAEHYREIQDIAEGKRLEAF